MSDRQYIINKIKENNKKHLLDLAKRIFPGDSVIPFIGAGMSRSIYGTWGEYLRTILPPEDEEGHQILDKQIAAGFYEEAAQRIKSQYGIDFYNWTAEHFDKSKIKSEALSPATKLLPRLFRGAMITTNLDRVIEFVYQAEGVEVTSILAGNFLKMQSMTRDASTCLWKIHGDIEDRKTWVLTKTDYQKQYDAEDGSFFRGYLEQILQNKVLLFLGCSLDSDMIVSVLEKLCQDNPYIRHYAILSVPHGYRFSKQDIREYNLRCQQLGRMGINPIWYPAGEYDFIEKYLRQLISCKETPCDSVKDIPFSFALNESTFVKKKATMPSSEN